MTDEQKRVMKERAARRTRIQAVTLDQRTREVLVSAAVKQAEAPKPEYHVDFDRSREVYAGRDICPWYFEGEERRVINRELVYNRDEARFITRFDTLYRFFNPLVLPVRLWYRVTDAFGW